MVDEKNVGNDTGPEITNVDEGTTKVKLGKKDDETPDSDDSRSLKKDLENDIPKGRTQAEKMFNDFVSTIRGRQEDFTKAISDYTSTMQKPLADVVETDGELIIKTDLPGVKKEDINVNLTESTVEITAKFQEDYAEEDVDYLIRERNFGETTKIIPLPAKVKAKEATAKYEDSILTITLPKEEAEKIIVDIK